MHDDSHIELFIECLMINLLNKSITYIIAIYNKIGGHKNILCYNFTFCRRDK